MRSRNPAFLLLVLALATAVGVGYFAHLARRPLKGPDWLLDLTWSKPDRPLPAADVDEISRLLAAVGAAAKPPHAAGPPDAFDCTGMLAALTDFGLAPPGGKFRVVNIKDADRAVEAAARSCLRAELPFPAWDRVAVRSALTPLAGREAVVVAAHTDSATPAAGPVVVRWFLRKAGGAWRVTDCEDAHFGLRLTHLMPLHLPGGWGTSTVPADQVRGLQEAARALRRHEAWQADQHLQRVGTGGPLARVADLTEAAARAECFRLPDAAGALDRAERGGDAAPGVKLWRAVVANRRKEFAAGLDRAAEYLAEVGPDPAGVVQEGLALEGLSRGAEAGEKFRAALDQAPGLFDALSGLGRVLPAGGRAELADRLGRAPNPEAAFVRLANTLRGPDDADTADRLVAAFLAVRPNHPAGVAEAVRVDVRRGRFPEAAAKLKAAVGRSLTDDGRQVVTGYVYAMAGAGRHLEAHAALPASAAEAGFRSLASDLEDDLPFPGQKSPRAESRVAVKTLAALVAAHRKRRPDDPWGAYYSGIVAARAGDHAAAERRFAEGLALLGRRSPWTGGTDSETRDEAIADFRSERVISLYRLGRAGDALREYANADGTFTQLANLFDGDGNGDGLAKFLADASRAAGAATIDQRRFWAAQADFLRKRYAPAAAQFERVYSALPERDYLKRRAAEQWVRALLRADQNRDAKRASERASEHLNLAVRAAAAAANRDTAALEELMGQATEGRFWLGAFYRDPDLGPILKTDARFAALRAKYPDLNSPDDDDE